MIYIQIKRKKRKEFSLDSLNLTKPITAIPQISSYVLTDLDSTVDHEWGVFSTDNLWTSHDFPAEASMSSLETLTGQSPSELAQTQQEAWLGL